MHKKGFTLLEILIAAVIMAMVMTGLAYVFLAGKRHLLHTRSKIQAAELGRLFLAPLQMDVRQGESSLDAQDGWDQVKNALRITGAGYFRYCDSVVGHTQQPVCPSQSERTLDGIEYSAQYTISDIQPDPIGHPQSILRKVVTTVTWNEPTP